MAKSLGNFYTLEDLIQKGIDPIAFRMWLYTSNYTTKTNFSLEAVTGSQTAITRLREAVLALGNDLGTVNTNYKARFIEYLDNNLDSPKALALVWELLKDTSLSDADKKAIILDFDKVLGFNLNKIKEDIIPEEVKTIALEREEARKGKDWAKSDELRVKVNSLGYEIKDTEDGSKISKI
jgi:cysteinyl-tRNA synthetase